MRRISDDYQAIEDAQREYQAARVSPLSHTREALEKLHDILFEVRSEMINTGNVQMDPNPVAMITPQYKTPEEIKERLTQWAQESLTLNVRPYEMPPAAKVFTVIYGNYRRVPTYLNQGIDPVVKWRLSLGDDGHSAR